MERIKLDLVPGCVKPILHASQYDNDREWTCDILDNGVPYKFVSGDTCEIHVRKGDNCAVTASVPVTVGQSYVVVTSTEQMCAVSGDNLAELVIMNGTKKIGSCNLILSVEADPLNGSKSSASEIHDLQNQVNDCVDEALSHKGASDIAFDNTDTGLEATNVQSAIEEVNTKTDEKADADDVYDKTYMNGIFEQIDNAFTGVNNSLNTKMDKANPTGTGTFSMNRKSGTTVGQNSFAEGYSPTASGLASHAEGYSPTASNVASHAEGYSTEASGQASHAEGTLCKATGNNAHAEGSSTEASGSASHAEGYVTKAIGSLSHAEGRGTIAKGNNQHASGQYNIADDNNTYAEIVGNGTNNNARSNARTLDWQGNEVIAGDLTYNGNKSLTSEVQRLDDKIDALPEAMVFKGTLGVGGTIQTLPTASTSNEGYTYKVITAGTYAGQSAKVGDVFTSDGSSWVLIPSGDEDNDTWRAIKVNGVEKLGNGISSGSLDVVDTDNIEAEFDNDGNKLKIKTKNIYTQEQVDNIVSDAIYNILPSELTPTGAIANFSTSLELPIVYEVENTATIVHQRGANFFDKNTMVIDNSYINDTDGTQRTNAGDKCTDYIEIKPNASYFIYSEQSSGKWGAWYDENKAFISGINPYGAKTSPANAKYMRLTIVRQGNGNPNTVSVNYPSSETTSHAYNEKEYPILDHSDLPIIKAFNGINNLYADNGDVSATYKVSIEDYVSRHSGGGNRSVNLAKSVEEEVKEEPKDEPLTRQER